MPATAAAAPAASAAPQQKLRAGIFGGMGPDATIEFYQRVLNKTRSKAGAKTDQDHILASIDMSPDILNRQDAILHGTGLERCGEQLRQSGTRLVASGCDFAVCVCNSAHFFAPNMQEGLGDVPLLSIIDLTSDRILQHLRERPSRAAIADEPVGTEAVALPEAEVATLPKVAILAASGCVHGGVYQKALQRRGINYFVPSEHIQETCMRAIYLAKSGKIAAGKEVFDEVLDSIVVDNGVDMVILGCTELPLLVDTTSDDATIDAAAAETGATDAPEVSSGQGGEDALVAEDAKQAAFGAWKKQRSDVKFFDTVDILADTVVDVCKQTVPLAKLVESLNNPQVFGAAQ